MFFQEERLRRRRSIPAGPSSFSARKPPSTHAAWRRGRWFGLEFDVERKDRFDRTLAYVYLPNAIFLNTEIVKQGYGHAYTQFPFRYLDQFRAYEREAREASRGLWGGEGAPVVLGETEQEGEAQPGKCVDI